MPDQPSFKLNNRLYVEMMKVDPSFTYNLLFFMCEPVENFHSLYLIELLTILKKYDTIKEKGKL